MKYQLHDNGWTVILEDFDFKLATQEDINQIAKLVANYTCVVAKSQSLTLEDELRVIKMFKDPEPTVDLRDENYKQRWVENSDGLLQRVTGELNKDGFEGTAGFPEEFKWHADLQYKLDGCDITWLHGIKGTKGSKTSWLNTINAYNDLTTSEKEFYENIKVITVSGRGHNSADDNTESSNCKIYYDVPINLVYKNIAGQIGLFLPFDQIYCVEGLSEKQSKEIIEPLISHITQEKYCYHHDWDDGDIVISEQWLGLHKRWAFENMHKRLLHRAVFRFPDQDYTTGP
jgi:alpha-ketoglutarate-dependent taurine dioxygenase